MSHAHKACLSPRAFTCIMQQNKELKTENRVYSKLQSSSRTPHNSWELEREGEGKREESGRERLFGWSRPCCMKNSMPRIVDRAWNATNPLVASQSSYWSAEALQKPDWNLGSYMAEALESLGGRMSFGLFTRRIATNVLFMAALSCKVFPVAPLFSSIC